jgi:hypothetical protein
MPILKSDQSRQRPNWIIAVLTVAGTLVALGAFGNHVWQSSEPTVLGALALTGPKCWVEEPVPYIYVNGRQPGKMDEYEVRFRMGDLGFYTRKN